MKKNLYLLLLLMLLPLAVHADDSGPCGDNVSYVFEEATGTLTISGTGAMTDRPWSSYSDKIKKVVLNDGVTSIGEGAFKGCSGLTSIEIPNSVTSIGSGAFSYCSDMTSIIIPNSVTSIGSGAFSYCSDMTSIIIPNSVTSIAKYAFDGCGGLTSIEIPNSVTSIGSSAFSGCSGLTSIEIPNSVTSIGKLVFQGCSGLTSINVESGNTNYDSRDNCNAIIEISSNTLIAGCKNTIIPNSVTSIGDYAFDGCSGLTSIEIPNSVTSIGNYAFRNCSGLTAIEIPNSVTSIGDYAFDGCSGLMSIEIPNSVTSIGNYAFRNCSGLTAIEIPNSVTSIGSSAFEYCSGLTSIEIPNSVTSIGNYAFNGCSDLTSIEIPNSVMSIGDYAFEGCSGLTSIEIPNSVTSIGYQAFYSCSGLTSIQVESGNAKYDSRNNCNAIIEISSNTLIAGCKNTIIPNSVTSIGYGAFSGCSGLTSIVIPNSVMSIGEGAFSGCSGLISVTCLAESVPTTGYYAFDISSIGSATLYVPRGCKTAYEATDVWKDFKEIKGNGDDSGSSGDNVSYIFEEATGTLTISGTGAMQNYSSSSSAPWSSYKSDIKKLVLNDGVTSIGNRAFYDCSGLTSIEIPNSVTSIGDWAFQNCSGLTSIEIPNSVTSIGYQALENCSGLTSINVESGNTKYDSRNNCNAIIETSSNTLILGCKSTIIPNSVTSIGYLAFALCSGLTSIVIPNTVTTIGGNAFSNCSGLTSIVIPNSVTSIGEGAFLRCSGLTSIEIPNSVTSIGERAFQNCSSLTSIEISNLVTRIGSYVFKGCSGLTSIVIPNTVTSIGSEAFYGCSGLTSVTCLAKNVPMTGYNAFGNSSIGSATLYVLKGCKAAYEVADAWKDFREIAENADDSGSCGDNVSYAFEEVTETLTISGTGAMSDYKSSSEVPWSSYRNSIKKVVLNNGVTSIGAYAFHYCSDLTSIVIPNSITSIGAYAFAECSDLTSIVIPNSVTSIGNNALSGCSGLTSIKVESDNTKYDSRDNCNAIIKTSSNTLIAGCKNTIIPNSVTSIGSGAFSYCSDMTSIIIPNSVTSIAKYAFDGCGSLTSIEIPNSVTSIGDYAFSYCSGLTSITCLAEDVPTTDYYSFYASPISSATLYVPNGCKAAYEAADVWKDFKEIVEMEAVPEITADNKSREYGEENPAFTYTTSASLTGEPSLTTTATKTSPVGEYDIVVERGTVTGDYTAKNGKLTVTKAPLTVTAKSYTIKQGDALPTFEAEYSGFKNNETASVLSTQPTVRTTATSASAPGTYDIIVSGASATNYDITYVKGTLTITKADEVVVTAKSYSRLYGEANPDFEYTTAGATLSGTPAISCAATVASPVGEYDIVASKGSVTNYNVTYVNGKLTITKAPLTVTAKSYTIKQGDALPTFEAEYSGFKNNETASVLSNQPTIRTEATSASEPGTYDIIVSGAAANNYDISYVKGTLKIIAADVEPVTEKTNTFSESINADTDLSNTVIDNTYYTLSSANGDGYDTVEKAIVLNSTTTESQMKSIVNAEIGDAIIRQNYNGIIFEVAAGSGTITIDAKTNGTHVLNVQIGKAKPSQITRFTRGTADVTYSVTSPTYIYLYASTTSTNAVQTRAISANNVLLYSYKVTPGTTGIKLVSIDNPVNVYDMQGNIIRTKVTTLNGLAKGIYIVNGRKVIVE